MIFDLSGPPLLSFAGAMVVLLLAHVLRAARHALLFPRKDVRRRLDLLVGLSLTYVLNVLLPFRIGEVARVLYVAARMRVRVSYVAATVLVERITDLAAVALIVLVLPFASGERRLFAIEQAAMLAGAALILVGIAVAVSTSAMVRHAVWKASSIFNNRIALALVDFAWSASRLVVDGALLRSRYLAYTAAMWGVYLLAYGLFGAAFGRTLGEVSLSLLGAPLRSLIHDRSDINTALLVFTAVPVLGIVAYGWASDRRGILASVTFAKRFGFTPVGLATAPQAKAFRSEGDYRTFLEAQFSATRNTVALFGNHGIDGAVIHRLLPGGSEAITAVVEIDEQFHIRKFATDGAADKLEVQAEWLRRHQADLPLTPLLGEHRGAGRFRYDMPYLPSARDFYEYVHTAPLSSSKAFLGQVVDAVDAFHRRHHAGPVPREALDGYLTGKVVKNASDILDFARLQVGPEYRINGEEHRLADWDRLLDLDWLRAQVRTLDTTIVHGDLTIENIIVCPDVAAGWYIIDPNPDNVFNTPLIDWAKLMQSLNLSYESLNKSGAARLRDNAIDLIFNRSRIYAELHGHFEEALATRLDAGQRREVAFHELVNYLRLTPYKIRHAPEKALTFFASTAVLLRDYERAGG